MGRYVQVLLLLFLLLPFENKAHFLSKQDLAFKQISYDQGLPGTNLRIQFQDSKGIIWISIEGQGVARYDGHNFILYSHESNNPNSISSNFVNDINEDNAGYLWFATENGLNSFDRNSGRFKNYQHNKDNENSLSDNVTYSIKKVVDGTFWIGTENGLVHFNPITTQFKRYFYQPQHSNTDKTVVHTILYKNEELLWLGTGSGLVKLNPIDSTFIKWNKEISKENSPVHSKILQILEDINGNLWLGTHRGLDRFDPVKEKFNRWYNFSKKDREELDQEGVNTFFLDDNGHLWVGTYTKGILIIDTYTDNYIRITKQDYLDYPLRSNHVKYIHQDREGIIWLGTKFEGLFKLIDKQGLFDKWPSNMNILKKFEYKYTMSFFEDKNQIIWLGTKFEGLYKIDLKNNVYKNFQHTHNDTYSKSLSSNRVQSILRDSKNRFWIGTESGLDRLDEASENISHYLPVPVNTIVEDHEGRIWIGSDQGLFVYNEANNKLNRFEGHSAMIFSSNDYQVLYIYQDSKNNIWFSTRNQGCFRYDPGDGKLWDISEKFTVFDNPESKMVRPVFEDKNNNIWIGTKSLGLLKYNYKDEKVVRFTIKDGLPSNFILALNEDVIGNIWIGTHNGISKLDIGTNNFVNFNKDYGLKSNITELGVGYKLRNGSLLFGGNNGFNLFYPKDIEPKGDVASLVLTSLKVYDENFLVDIDSDAQLTLNYDDNNLSFDFTLTDYRDPFRQQYKCILEGFDQDWVNLGNRSYANYTSLNPGSYIFKVTAANQMGKWVKEPLEIKIDIKQPFFATWLFKIIAIIIVIVAMFLIYKQKTAQNKQNKEYLHDEIQKRTNKIEKTNQELKAKNDMIEKQKQHIERQQQELEEKVKKRTRDLEIAKEKAVESDRLKSSFLANMSHEIRTPINAIAGFSNLLEEENTSPKELKYYVGVINENIDSLLKLIEDILDISKIEAGHIKLSKDIFNLNSLFYDIYSYYHEQLDKQNTKKIKFIWKNKSTKLPYIAVYSDQIRIKQILTNLLSNAFKYSHKGIVEFGYNISNSDLDFFVTDNGIGISKTDQEIIFNRFVKVEEKSALYRGTGIGLSIVKGLIDLMGGQIFVESEISKGSTFKVLLPNVVDVSYTNKKVKQKADLSSNLNNKTILIVEDEDSNFFLLNSYLKKTSINIMRAVDGEDAIHMCNSQLFDLILMDIKMPKLNGYESVEIIRKDFPDIPIIAQTAYALTGDKAKIIEAGFTDYLAKPIMKADLLEKISLYL